MLPGIRLLLIFSLILGSCSTIRTPPVKRYRFPKEAYLEEPKRTYQTLGLVKTMVEYATLNPDEDELRLCENYYNKAVGDLLRRARDVGGDAIMGVRSVVFLIDGKTETYPTPECSDDGQEGQILAQAIAIRWKLPKGEPVTPLPTSEVLDPPKKLAPGPFKKAVSKKRKRATTEDLEKYSEPQSPRSQRREPFRPNEPIFIDGQ